MQTAKTIDIILNGQTKTINHNLSIARLIQTLEINPLGIAVEVSGCVISKSQWPTTTINAGDRIEIIQMVGGG